MLGTNLSCHLNNNSLYVKYVDRVISEMCDVYYCYISIVGKNWKNKFFF